MCLKENPIKLQKSQSTISEYSFFTKLCLFQETVGLNLGLAIYLSCFIINHTETLNIFGRDKTLIPYKIVKCILIYYLVKFNHSCVIFLKFIHEKQTTTFPKRETKQCISYKAFDVQISSVDITVIIDDCGYHFYTT